MSEQPRPRAFYIGVLALPILMLLYLVGTGRMAAYRNAFDYAQRRSAPAAPGGDEFVTALLWLGALAPLAFAAWEIGRRHTAARRLNYTFVVGLREVVRRALGLTDPASEQERAEAFARPPRDRPLAALGWGLAVAILVPTFFATFGWPAMRTPRGLLWLCGTGVLFGATIYCRRRAVAYLRDDPTRGWDMFREWRLLNPNRYDEPGRVFVRWQIAAGLLMPIWWVGGAIFLLFP
jgi:Na+/proline symporter